MMVDFRLVTGTEGSGVLWFLSLCLWLPIFFEVVGSAVRGFLGLMMRCFQGLCASEIGAFFAYSIWFTERMDIWALDEIWV